MQRKPSDKPDAWVSFVFLTLPSIILVPKSYILVILHFVSYDYLWQFCGCIYLNILPQTLDFQRFWQNQVCSIILAEFVRIVSEYSFEFLTILCPKTSIGFYRKQNLPSPRIFCHCPSLYTNHQHHNLSADASSIAVPSMQNGYHSCLYWSYQSVVTFPTSLKEVS
jgi:hypothetical protein